MESEWFCRRNRTIKRSAAEKAASEKYYQKNKEKLAIANKTRRKKKKDYYNLYYNSYRTDYDYVWKVNNYRKLDQKRGMESNLTPEWFLQNIKNQSCTYCGTKENIGCDRIDNVKGHTIENCIPCCSDCNYVRRDLFSVEEMKQLGIVLARIQKRRKSDSETM